MRLCWVWCSVLFGWGPRVYVPPPSYSSCNQKLMRLKLISFRDWIVLAVGIFQFQPRLMPLYGTRQIVLCVSRSRTVTPAHTAGQPVYSRATSDTELSSTVKLKSIIGDSSRLTRGHAGLIAA